MNSKASKMMKMGMFSSGRDRRGYDDYRRYERDYEPREYHRGRDYDDYDRDYRDGDYRGGRSHRRMRDDDGMYRSDRGRRERRSREYGYDYDDDDYHAGKIRAGGMFWMDDPRNHIRKLDKETAERWVSEMDKADGSGKGGKWTYQQVEELMKAKGYKLDPVDMYIAMNMIHSDYGNTLSKYGVTSQDVYLALAKDWIEDDDVAAGDMKTTKYYYDIVK